MILVAGNENNFGDFVKHFGLVELLFKVLVIFILDLVIL
jgi:hypothetical protein